RASRVPPSPPSKSVPAPRRADPTPVERNTVPSQTRCAAWQPSAPPRLLPPAAVSSRAGRRRAQPLRRCRARRSRSARPSLPRPVLDPRPHPHRMDPHLLGDHEVAAELVEVAGRILRIGQYLSKPPIRLAAPPLSRVPHRHLFE